MHRLIPPMHLCDAVSARGCGGLHEDKENIKIQSWNISVLARQHVGTLAHAGLDSISLCNPNVRIMYVPTCQRADEHSFKVVSIVLTEIKLCGDVPTRQQCRNLRPGQCIGHGMCLCADMLMQRHLGKWGVGQYVGYGVCGYADVPT